MTKVVLRLASMVHNDFSFADFDCDQDGESVVANSSLLQLHEGGRFDELGKT